MNDKSFPTSPLDNLPVFASDLEIAQAIVGKTEAAKWLKTGFPALQKIPGFPKVDAFHGGRAVPLVKLFYANYFGLPLNGGIGMPDPHEEEREWKPSRRRKTVAEPPRE